MIIAPDTATAAAIRTLKQLGYTYVSGAELWKPPVGHQPGEYERGYAVGKEMQRKLLRFTLGLATDEDRKDA